MSNVAHLKRAAALRALAEVQNGMMLGLGSGTTTTIFVELLGEAVQRGAVRDIQAVSTSEKTANLAQSLGIPLTRLASAPRLDLTVDGADEVDPDLHLIKGLGHALLREKIVEIHTARLLIIVDASKLSPRLGLNSPLPVEVVPYAWETTVAWLGTLGCRAELWRDERGAPLVTDNNNYLARCWFPDGIADPHALARQLADRPGIVEHGLFLDMADLVVVADDDGIRTLERKI